MRFIGWAGAFALLLNMPITAAVEARDDFGQPNASGAESHSAVLVECPDSGMGATLLSPHAVIRRTTYSAKMERPNGSGTGNPIHHKHHSIPHKQPHSGGPTKDELAKKQQAAKLKQQEHKPRKQHVVSSMPHKPIHHKPGWSNGKNRPPSHHPQKPSKAPALHRVTYASPLCGQRAPQMSAMLGLPDSFGNSTDTTLGTSPITDLEAVIDAPITPNTDVTTLPILPIGPAPRVIGSGVPEPQSWAMMLAGFGIVGWSIRRRRFRGSGVRT